MIRQHTKYGLLTRLAAVTLLFFGLTTTAPGQTSRIDNLNKALASAKDTARPFLLNKIAGEIIDSIEAFPPNQKDSLLHVAESHVSEAEVLSRQLKYNSGIGISLYLSGAAKVTRALRNLDQAINDYTNALSYLKAGNERVYLANCFYRIALGCHFIGRLDSSIVYYDSAINSFLQLKDTQTATLGMIWQGHDYFDKGDYRNAYIFGTKALSAALKTRDTTLIIFANQQFEGLFLNAGLPERAIDYLHTIVRLHPLTMPVDGKTTLPYFMPWALWTAGEAYLKLNEVDSAVYLSQFIPKDTTDGDSYRFYGQLYTALHEDDRAIKDFAKGFELKREIGHGIGLSGSANELAQIYLKKKDFRSAMYYANFSLGISDKIHAMLEKRNAVGILSDIYSQTGNYKKAYYYGQMYKTLNDSLASEQDRKKLILDLTENQLNDQRKQSLLLSQENQLKQQQLHNETLLKNFFIAGAVVFLLIAAIIFRNYRQKQKANSILEQQKNEIQFTLSELKSAQSQLIQAEKMASLGEMTAGIAHEIQNPLNFVNNFSEVNVELSEELKDEFNKADLPSEVKSNLEPLIDTILGNQEKIVHHGKRADSIVKSMLAHSRTSTGQKTATDLNALVDEWLRLSYNGMRAKEKSFQCNTQTDFDPGVGKIDIVPQDIGRVLLNLFNNAFYAVNERKKLQNENYDPLVFVSTKRTDGHLSIKARDNGSGIPEKVLDKIFQPFFTTKPTGQGTGLGLSLSYDIIKAYGGEIKVETKEGAFTEFVVELPT